MMYSNDRKGILDEYTWKISSEAHHANQSDNQQRMQEHFIRGLVSDIVDRVAEAPEKFQIED